MYIVYCVGFPYSDTSTKSLKSLVITTVLYYAIRSADVWFNLLYLYIPPL